MRRYDETVRRQDDDARIDSWATSCQVPSTLGWALPTARPSQSPAPRPFGPVALARVYRAMRQVNASFMPAPRLCPFLSASAPQPSGYLLSDGAGNCQSRSNHSMPDPALSRPVLPSGPAACHAVPMPSCFDTSLAQHLRCYHDGTTSTAHATTKQDHNHHHHRYHHHYGVPPWPAHPSTLPRAAPTAQDHHWSLCEHRPATDQGRARSPKSDRHGILSYSTEAPGYRSEAWAPCGGPAAQT